MDAAGNFLHDSHVHPGSPNSGTSGTFTIPTTGHDFSGNARYRITLTVTESDGLTTSRSAIIYPTKVNLTFDTAPSGLTYYSAGNSYRLAVPKAAANGLSQAIWYASNIKAAAAGANTVTVTLSASTPYVDVRALEHAGLDPVNPFDIGSSASGNSNSASGGAVTTTAANELIFGAGMTGGLFSAAGATFTNRVITQDADIAEDRIVTSAGSYSATDT